MLQNTGRHYCLLTVFSQQITSGVNTVSLITSRAMECSCVDVQKPLLILIAIGYVPLWNIDCPSESVHGERECFLP